MAAIRYYVDENAAVAVAERLTRRQIELFSIRELGQLGGSDESHLYRATATGCTLCAQTPIADSHSAVSFINSTRRVSSMP